ncbi:S9 family peptidase [Sphingomonas japonica]|uniref:Dipeptidyl-peptidase-4 n=1 Tax=Sphingomonas japonica TaxID=511662 RepID=A0ABX0U5K9_9SPHN|nr:DPP IV N-terminal domain-containing protein [Sphingomonas japonica]NIJ24671.1 dipeptidyl-peptidase-4 [Sphingomonas japonica]
MRTWMIGWALASASTLAWGAPAMARDPSVPVQTAATEQGGELTLDRLYASPGLNGSQPSALQLSPDGKLLTFLKAREDERDRIDLWARDTTTGQERMLVDSKKVGTGAELSEVEKMQRERLRIGGIKGITRYDFAPDGNTILVPLDGDLYSATLDGDVRRLTDTPGGEINAVVSPAGGFVSFVRDQNLYVQPLGGGVERALTTDGKGTVHWGEAEFVADEEMGRRTGYLWAPQDQYVAVERYDEAQVGVFSRAAIGAEGTKVYDQRYPAAGTPNVLVDLYVMRPDGSGRVKVDLGSNPDIYLARVNWLPDGSALLVQRQSRDQKTLDMLKVDPATGKSTVLFTEKSGDRSWLNLNDSLRTLKDGSLIWESERDGFAHLYRWKDGKWTQLTKGDWVMLGLVGVDEAKGRVYFMANKDTPLEQHLYTVDLARPGAVTRLTEPGWWYGASMDPGASRLILTRSNDSQPSQTYLADTSGKRISWINENALAEGHPYYPYLASHEPTKYGTIKAKDGTTLYWSMITPKLEAGKKYPVFFEHYGGPGTGQNVTRRWAGGRAQWLVDQGFVYFQIDNRGSFNRGTEFENEIYRAMGTVEVEDQLSGAEFLKSQSFVDPDRIATYGWSYGGYMTLKMLEAAPGVFAAGISGAPVSKWELYDTHYTERYMGNPKTDAAAYAASNTIGDAGKIVDPLLIIHGMADDNVFFENTTSMMTALQQAGRPFEAMVYPGQTHAFGDQLLAKHTWINIMDFLDRRLGGMQPK